jgi:hypothetical protein
MSSWTCMSKMWSCVVKDSWKMVDVSQVMISNTITCKIHTSRLTTHVWNELSCSCNCTEILDLMSMKLELLSPLLSDSPFLSSKSFFVFPIFDVHNAKSRPTFCHVFWGWNPVNKYRNGNCRYCIIFTVFTVTVLFLLYFVRKPKSRHTYCKRLVKRLGKKMGKRIGKRLTVALSMKRTRRKH